MKLIVARVMPLLLALLVPSIALAETPAGHKPRAGATTKRAKVKQAKPAKVKAPKAMKKAPKAPKAMKKAPRAH